MATAAWYTGIRSPNGESGYGAYRRRFYGGEPTIENTNTNTMLFEDPRPMETGSFGSIHPVLNHRLSAPKSAKTVTKRLDILVKEWRIDPSKELVLRVPNDVYFSRLFQNAGFLMDVAIDPVGHIMLQRAEDEPKPTGITFTWRTYETQPRTMVLTLADAPDGFRLHGNFVLSFTMYMDKADFDAFEMVHILKKKGFFNRSIALSIFTQTRNQLRDAYTYGAQSGQPFIYTDMKLENILVFGAKCLLGDFGSFARKGDVRFTETYSIPFRYSQTHSTLVMREKKTKPPVDDFYGVWSLYILYLQLTESTLLNESLVDIYNEMITDDLVSFVFEPSTLLQSHNERMDVFINNVELIM